MTDFKTDFKKLVTYGFGQVINLVSPFLVIPHIIRTSGLENFGKISFVFSICLFLMVVVDYGNDITSVKEIAVNRNDKSILNKLLLENLSSRFLLLLFISVLYVLLSFSFGNNFLLYSTSFTIVIGQFINPSWFLQGVENVNLITIGNIFSKVIYLALTFLFVNSVENYIWVNLFWGIGMIVSYSIIYIIIFRNYSFTFYKIPFKDQLQFLKSNFLIFTSQLFLAGQMFLPIIIVGKFGGYILAGKFKIIDQILSIFKTYIFLFFNFIYPKVSYKFKEKTDAYGYWLTVNFCNVILITLGCLFLYIFKSFVLGIFGVNEYSNIEFIFSISLIYPIIFSINVSFRQLILALGFNSFYVKITTYISILYLLGTFILILNYGLREIFIYMIFLECLLFLIYIFKLNKIKNVKKIVTKNS